MLAETVEVRTYADREGKMPSFCSNCGAPVNGKFCAACGAAINGGLAVTQNVTPQATPTVQPVAVPPAVHKYSGAKVLLVVLGVLIVFGAVGVGGIVFVGYRAKQKIAEMTKDYGL